MFIISLIIYQLSKRLGPRRASHLGETFEILRAKERGRNWQVSAAIMSV
jgi:hypothetical protein